MEISEETMTNNRNRIVRIWSIMNQPKNNHNRNMSRRSWKLAARHHHILIDNSVPREGREKKLAPITAPWVDAVMKYVIPSLVGLVVFKYQSKPESLFVENPAHIWCFVVTNCVYWVIVGGILEQMRTLESKYLRIFSSAAFVTGVLSALSLLSILLPDRIRVVPFMIWIPLPLVLAWPILYNAYTWLVSRITTHFCELVFKETSLPV